MDKKEVFGTKEWSDISANCQDGCEHDCAYCYAKATAVNSGRRTVDDWKENRPAFRKMKKAVKHSPCKVMFPTTHDILPENIDLCIKAIGKLLEAGHELLIVSKPHLQCIKKICAEFDDYKDRILFRFTIGSASDVVLSHWEPGAPCFAERVACLKFTFECGFETSVSCEPMLDDNIGAVIVSVEPYVTDAIWLGKMNSAYDRLASNGGTDEDFDLLDILLRTQSDDRIHELYAQYASHPKIKWKESIKRVVGIEVPTEPGMDI
jgi:DNA repair photolyase